MKQIKVNHRRKTNFEIEQEKRIIMQRNKVKKSDIKFCKSCQQLFISSGCVICENG